MSKKDEALKLALEALKQIDEAMPFPVAKLAQQVIREALAEQETVLPGGGHVPAVPVAVYGYCPECGGAGVMRERRPNGADKCTNGHKYPSSKALAEQPAQQECNHCGGTGDVSGEYPGVACPECSGSGVQVKPEFFTHSVEQPYDWSDWVCPDPKSYLMKCCDCGLVHEAQFGVVRYKSEAEHEACDMVDDPNLQAVFRMRRSGQWSPEDTAHRAGGLPMEQPAQQQEPVAWVVQYAHDHKDIDFYEPDIEDLPVGTKLYTSPPASKPWVGLTEQEREKLRWQALEEDAGYTQLIKATEAKLKEKNA